MEMVRCLINDTECLMLRGLAVIPTEMVAKLMKPQMQDIQHGSESHMNINLKLFK